MAFLPEPATSVFVEDKTSKRRQKAMGSDGLGDRLHVSGQLIILYDNIVILA